MTLSVFIDTNIPIYAAGAAHPLKAPCAEVILLASDHEDAFITNAEVLQELIHRYVAIKAWDRGLAVFQRFAALMETRTSPVLAEDVVLAASLVSRYPSLSPRDLIHLAVMSRLGVTRIVSADTGFDRISGIERLDPARFSEWRDSVSEPL